MRSTDSREKLRALRRQQNAEVATGLLHRHSGRYHPTKLGEDGKPRLLDDDGARNLFLAGEGIECPGAGAGSVGLFLESVGMELVRTLDDTSSAGDWCFEADDQDGERYFVRQQNRYPGFGFTYFLEPWEPHHRSWDTV